MTLSSNSFWLRYSLLAKAGVFLEKYLCISKMNCLPLLLPNDFRSSDFIQFRIDFAILMSSDDLEYFFLRARS